MRDIRHKYIVNSSNRNRNILKNASSNAITVIESKKRMILFIYFEARQQYYINFKYKGVIDNTKNVWNDNMCKECNIYLTYPEYSLKHDVIMD